MLSALRDNPAAIRTPLNLSDAHLRALISAGSFTSAHPAATTSRVEQSLAANVAAMDVGTLFPPEGQGQFVPPGELPPTGPAPHHAPSRVPSTPPRPPVIAPHAAAPQAKGAPTGPAPRLTPVFTPISVAPRAPGITPTAAPSTGAPAATSASPGANTGASGSSNNTPSGATGHAGPVSHNFVPAGVFYTASGNPECGCRGSCEVAILAIVAETTATAHTAIAAITAIAGLP